MKIHCCNADKVQSRHTLTKAGSSRDSLRFLIISWATLMRYSLDLANWEKRRPSSNAKFNLGNATGEREENCLIRANIKQLLWREIWNWMIDEHQHNTSIFLTRRTDSERSFIARRSTILTESSNAIILGVKRIAEYSNIPSVVKYSENNIIHFNTIHVGLWYHKMAHYTHKTQFVNQSNVWNKTPPNAHRLLRINRKVPLQVQLFFLCSSTYLHFWYLFHGWLPHLIIAFMVMKF